MNDHELNFQLFPKLTQLLKQRGEVWVPIDYISQFAAYLKHNDTTLWRRTEQDPNINDQLESRFYIRETGSEPLWPPRMKGPLT